MDAKRYSEAIQETTRVIEMTEAIKEADYPKLEKIIRSMTNNAAVDQVQLFKSYISDNFGTLLHFAASFGSKSFCQLLVSNGVPINVIDKDGNTALHKAAIASRTDIVEYFIKLTDIDDSIKNKKGRTAIECTKSKDCFALMESHKKSVYDKKIKEIVLAIANKNIEEIKSSFKSGIAKNILEINMTVDQKYGTMLHYFAHLPYDDFLVWLIENGADAFVKNSKGKVPLELATDEKVKAVLINVPMKNSNILPEQGSVIRMEGFLHKWTNYAIGFKKRYFVLENGSLSYFKSQSDYPVSCRGSIYLGFSVISSDDADKSRFEIMGKGVSYHLRADSPAEAKRWIVGLTEAKNNLESHPTEVQDFDRADLKSSASILSFGNELDVSFQTKIRNGLLQIDVGEQLLTNLKHFVEEEGSDPVKKVIDGFHSSSLTILNTLRNILEQCEDMDAEWSKKFQREVEREIAYEESIEILALENSKLTVKSKAQTEESEDVDEFYDAEEENVIEKEAVKLRNTNTDSLVVKSGEGYPQEFRKALPKRVKEPSDVSLWSVIKNSIGKDFTKMAIPVNFNEPTSMLQRLCEDMEYSDLLDIANSKENPFERIAYVGAFAASNYSSTVGRVAKPFNPLLGETYEYVSKERGFRYISEQVSHHPPISSCYCESENYIFWSEVYVKPPQFVWPKSLEIVPLGVCHVILKKTNEHFSWKKVTTCVHNLILGKLWIDHYGKMIINNHATNDTCELEFKPSSSGWKTPKETKVIEGHVFDASKQSKIKIKGKWNESLHAYFPDESHHMIWKITPHPEGSEKNFNFTKFAITLNDITPELKLKLCPTDSRLRPDQRAMEIGEYDEASSLKSKLEEKQRATRKVQEKQKIVYTPRWFYKSIDEDTNSDTWIFKGNYWESRETGKWENIPDIF